MVAWGDPVLTIDAGHDYANVAHDIAAWRQHIAPGAIGHA
jgi:hypothetical protein